jgi:hypothetical protein
MNPEVELSWRGDISDDEVVRLTIAHGGDAVAGWWDRIRPHSLGWVTARVDGDIVGFVNVAWDGGARPTGAARQPRKARAILQACALSRRGSGRARGATGWSCGRKCKRKGASKRATPTPPRLCLRLPDSSRQPRDDGGAGAVGSAGAVDDHRLVRDPFA